MKWEKKGEKFDLIEYLHSRGLINCALKVTFLVCFDNCVVYNLTFINESFSSHISTMSHLQVNLQICTY